MRERFNVVERKKLLIQSHFLVYLTVDIDKLLILRYTRVFFSNANLRSSDSVFVCPFWCAVAHLKQH